MKTIDPIVSPCEHVHVVPTIVDQTLGVACTDCKSLLAWCWDDHHISEPLWNRAAASDPKAVPCDENRDDVCALCSESIYATAGAK